MAQSASSRRGELNKINRSFNATLRGREGKMKTKRATRIASAPERNGLAIFYA
jgi:hypothetical protein